MDKIPGYKFGSLGRDYDDEVMIPLDRKIAVAKWNNLPDYVPDELEFILHWEDFDYQPIFLFDKLNRYKEYIHFFEVAIRYRSQFKETQFHVVRFPVVKFKDYTSAVLFKLTETFTIKPAIEFVRESNEPV